MKQILKNKRGVMGLDVAKSFVLGLLSLVIIGVTVMIVLSSLGATSVVSSNTQVQTIINNTSSGLTSFFSNVTTWLALLGVVILILIIAVVIVVVNRFGGAGAGTTSL